MTTFHKLSREALEKIVDIQVARLLKRMEELKSAVELSREAKAFLAAEGWDLVFGARPLKRAVQKHVQDVLSA